MDQGVLASNGDGSSPFHRQEEKWWLPVPQVPPCGLNESSRKHLQNKRDCANQISKAVMAINNTTLAEIEVPDTYLESLPKVPMFPLLWIPIPYSWKIPTFAMVIQFGPSDQDQTLIFQLYIFNQIY